MNCVVVWYIYGMRGECGFVTLLVWIGLCFSEATHAYSHFSHPKKVPFGQFPPLPPAEFCFALHSNHVADWFCTRAFATCGRCHFIGLGGHIIVTAPHRLCYSVAKSVALNIGLLVACVFCLCCGGLCFSNEFLLSHSLYLCFHGTRLSLLQGLRTPLGSRFSSSSSSAPSHAVDGNTARRTVDDGKTLGDFLKGSAAAAQLEDSTSSLEYDFNALREASDVKVPKSFFIETHGCQMNVSDSEIVRAVLNGAGYYEAPSVEESDVILVNTCSIRENAEAKVWHRLDFYNSIRKRPGRSKKNRPVVGVLGKWLLPYSR